MFSLIACNRNDKPEETHGTEETTKETAEEATKETTELKYTFLSNEEKFAWKSNLTAILSTIEIHEYEPGIPGSFAIGLMDIDFDNSPEVFAAYAGGTMGNVFFHIYDLNTGKEIIAYNAAHWESSDNIYLCVADRNGELVILSEGSIRTMDYGWVKMINLFPKNIDLESVSLMTEDLFTESVSSEVAYYSYNGNVVEKSQYDEYYQKFLNEYNIIESTQIQLIKWSSIESENKNELLEKMADALINSPQEFLDCKK